MCECFRCLKLKSNFLIAMKKLVTAYRVSLPDN